MKYRVAPSIPPRRGVSGGIGWPADLPSPAQPCDRERCSVQTFSVATLRGGAAVLTEAVELAPDLRDQFASLLPGKPAEEKDESASASPDDASDEWTARACSLKDLVARVAGPPPNPDLLAEIAPLVESLRGIEPAPGCRLTACRS